jgi:hypothetical protein
VLRLSSSSTQSSCAQPPSANVQAGAVTDVGALYRLRMLQIIENTKAVEGYMNKPKGLKQILWERGLYHDAMIKDVKKDDKKGRDQSYSMVHVSHHSATQHN